MTPKMIAVREWSCPEHDCAQTHECDCEHCEFPYYACDLCAVAKWVDKLDANGDPVLREATLMDNMCAWLQNDLVAGRSLFAAPLITGPIQWMEDNDVPKVETI